MNTKVHRLHERAIEFATAHRKSEAALISILQDLDSCRGYLHFGARSLYDYCERILKLSEATSYNLITVARRAKTVPALKAAVESGSISVSKAKKIAPVLTRENQEAWLALAASKSSREIERAVAKADPKAARVERLDYIDEDRIRARLDLPEALMKKLRRIQDLESQRKSTASNLVETIEAMADHYLQHRDPVQKAKRAAGRKFKKSTKGTVGSESKHPTQEAGFEGFEKHDLLQDCSRDLNSDQQQTNPNPKRFTQRDGKLVPGPVRYIPAAVRHAVYMRDEGRCTYTDSHGRCTSSRWIDMHHVVPRSEGGANTVENLRLLCGSHHRKAHLTSRVRERDVPYSASA